ARVKHMGIVYSWASTHLGNSLVSFYPCSNCSSPLVPGSIKYIYELDGVLTLAIQRQGMVPRGNNTVDMFVAYPHFPAKTYSSTLSETLEAVTTSWIHAHYARWPISDDLVVVLSL
ncbi:hypothetical protein HD554DRAFT_2005407, partial [Boletus coccyginus]